MAKIFGVVGDLLRVVVAGQNFMPTVAPEPTSSPDLYNVRLEAGNSPPVSLASFPDTSFSVVNQDQSQGLPISSSISSEQQFFDDQILSGQAFELNGPKGANKTICISNIIIKSSDTQVLRDDVIIPIGDLGSLCDRDWSWGTLHDGTRQRCIRLDGQSDEINKANEFLHLDMDQLAEILSVSEDVRKTNLETACKIFGNSPVPTYNDYKMSFSQGINSVFGIDTISLVNLTSEDLTMGEIPADCMDGADFWVADNRLLDSQSHRQSDVTVAQISKKPKSFGLEVRVYKNIPLVIGEEFKYKPRISSRVFAALRIPDFEVEQQYLDNDIIEIIPEVREELYTDEELLIEELEDELAEEEMFLEEIYEDDLLEDDYYPNEEIFEQELLTEEPLTEEAIIIEEEKLAREELAAEKELLKEEIDAEEELFMEEMLAEEALLHEEIFLTDEQKQIEQELLAEKELCAEEELAEKEIIAEEQLMADERLAEQDLLAKKPLSEEMFALEMLEKKKNFALQDSLEEEGQLEEDEASVEDVSMRTLIDAVREAENLVDEDLIESQPFEQVVYLESLPVDESRSLDEMLMQETFTEDLRNDLTEELLFEEPSSQNDQPTRDEFFSVEPCLEHMPIEESEDEFDASGELFPEEMFSQNMPADEEIFEVTSFPEKLDEQMLKEMLQGFMVEESLPLKTSVQETEINETELRK